MAIAAAEAAGTEPGLQADWRILPYMLLFFMAILYSCENSMR
jgi:hypothetical protein